MSYRLALANAIEDAGIPRDKAERVASVIFDAIHDNFATKADVQALGAELKAAITAQVGSIRAELNSDITGVRSLLASENLAPRSFASPTSSEAAIWSLRPAKRLIRLPLREIRRQRPCSR
jgi:hypothetical protein